MRKSERGGSLSPASCDGTASSTIRISLRPRPAIVIGSATSRAGHSVPPQRTVANVSPGGKNAPVALRVHLELRTEQFGLIHRHQTLGDRSTALRFRRKKAKLVVSDEVDGG